MGRQRIVVKIGSSSLTTKQGALSMEMLSDHVNALALLKQQGHEVILISSGAVAAGFSELGYPFRPITIAGKQAAAAVGQGLLMQGYIELFKRHNITPAQLLLTRQDFENQERFSNAYSTISELLKRGALPIINENDSTSIEELTFGDNDMLSALVSGFIHAQTLCILTDVNGLYDDNPTTNPNAKKFHYLPEVTDELMMLAGGAGTKVGTGGMKSKVSAAKTALSLGVNVFIGRGSGKQKLIDIISGKGDGTYLGSFQHDPVMPTVKQWIALHSTSSGRIIIDDGAEKAVLAHGKSLLPAGVVSVEGTFNEHDVVEVFNKEGYILGKGKSNVSSEQLHRVKGLSSTDAQLQTGRLKPEIIHRNNWVSLKKERIK
ncbi:glutamate 5-kinase [Bacillus solitudinis]|uniref:glutamate 5-kinase n=1 Tax=Bacillus solitudinis TaxID=2014074 RepID=UPI000C23A8CD|nr:glutamate 5-kinase [Bacillus solitudinis]